jgi:hypothetical protein
MREKIGIEAIGQAAHGSLGLGGEGRIKKHNFASDLHTANEKDLDEQGQGFILAALARENPDKGKAALVDDTIPDSPEGLLLVGTHADIAGLKREQGRVAKKIFELAGAAGIFPRGGWHFIWSP